MCICDTLRGALFPKGHERAGRCAMLGDSVRGGNRATYNGASVGEFFVLPAMRRAEVSRGSEWERGDLIYLQAQSAGNREEVHSDLP